MEYELKEYIRDEFNRPIGVMLAVVNEENPMYVHIGVSLCNKHDKFNKTTGYELAKDKTKNPNSWYKIHEQGHSTFHNMAYTINSFVFRCHAYFKNKMVTYPKIEYTYFD